MRCLELVRTAPPRWLWRRLGVVNPIDVVGYVRGRQVTIRVDALFYPFLFQTAEEELSDRLVSAVGTSAHAWLKVVVCAETPP